MTASVANTSIPPYPNYSPLIHLLKDDPTQAAHLRKALQDDGYRALLADDDPPILDVHAHMLRSAGMEVHTLSNPPQLMEKGFVGAMHPAYEFKITSFIAKHHSGVQRISDQTAGYRPIYKNTRALLARLLRNTDFKSHSLYRMNFDLLQRIPYSPPHLKKYGKK